MEAYWNKIALDRPPTTTWQCLSKQFDSQRFTKVVNKVITELEMQHFFKTEAALLSRLIYRMKSKLRSDKGLKNMEKVNRALLNYLKLSLENDYKYLKDNTDCEGDVSSLPSRQMLQYALVRTQGFAKLMCRIECVAVRAGDFFRARLQLGQAWNLSIVAYSCISRIWLLSRYLTKKCCIWYDRLYVYLDKLTEIGVPWLPDNYRFPENLKTWLSVTWIDDEIKNFSEKETSIDNIFNLITRDDDPDEDEEIDENGTEQSPVASQSNKSETIVEKQALPNKINSSGASQMEIGERISRDAFAANLVKKTPDATMTTKQRGKMAKKIGNGKSTKIKVPNVDDLQTEEDVVKFLSLDSYPGLDKMQWKIIQKNVRKLLLKLKKGKVTSDPKKKEILVKNTIRALQEWLQ